MHSQLPRFLVTFFDAGDKMENEVLKQVFQRMHSKIVTSVSPEPLMDVLFSKEVISFDDYERVRGVLGPRERCRELLSLLRVSSHPETFITLRLALISEHKWIVDEIDEQLPSQLPQGSSTGGKLQLYELVNPSYILYTV